MSAMSDYLERSLINHIFRSAAYSQPATIAIALCTSAPIEADSGDLTGKEVVGGGYARFEVSRGDSKWTSMDSDGTTANDVVITFPEATGNWSGPITHIAIVDSTVIGSGNLLFYGELVVPKTVTTGDIFQIALNQLSIQIDN